MAKRIWRESDTTLLEDLLGDGLTKQQILHHPDLACFSSDCIYRHIRMANGDEAPDLEYGADSVAIREGACRKHLKDLIDEFGAFRWPGMSKRDKAEEAGMDLRRRRPPNLRMMGETYA